MLETRLKILYDLGGRLTAGIDYRVLVRNILHPHNIHIHPSYDSSVHFIVSARFNNLISSPGKRILNYIRQSLFYSNNFFRK